MNSETRHQLVGIYRIVASLLQELFICAMDNRITAIRIREWAETLDSLAERVRRLQPTNMS